MAEVNGDTTSAVSDTTTDTRQSDADNAPEVNVLGEPISRGAHGKWLPGSRPNPLGRIKKKPTVLDETLKLASQAKHRKQIARAWVQTMELPHTPAGNRARADYRDTFHGVPKQTLVLEQGESPLDVLLMRRAERSLIVEGQTVDGEAREIDADGDAGA